MVSKFRFMFFLNLLPAKNDVPAAGTLCTIIKEYSHCGHKAFSIVAHDKAKGRYTPVDKKVLFNRIKLGCLKVLL